MTSRAYKLARNVFVGLGLWWCFSFLGAILVMAWNSAFVVGRTFTGEHAGLVMSARSLPAYIVCGFLVGLGIARFVESPRVLVWAVVLGGLIAIGNLSSWGGLQYRGGYLLDSALRGVVIVASIVSGCWFGVRRWNREVKVLDGPS